MVPPGEIATAYRRSFLKVGALSMGGLALSDALRLQAQGAVSPSGRAKSVIMICLEGGPSHLDMYDLKPGAPSEFRGEFRPIRTNVPGMDLCEHLPRQAKLADKFSIVRSATWTEVEHQRMEIFTGFPTREHRPAFGSFVSKMARGGDELLPKFVSLSGGHRAVAEAEQPLYVGAQHRPFVPTEEGLKSMSVDRKVDLSRLRSRKELLGALDTLRRDVDARGEMGALDAFTGQALDMVTGGRARKAFDLSDEKPETLDRYRAARATASSATAGTSSGTGRRSCGRAGSSRPECRSSRWRSARGTTTGASSRTFGCNSRSTDLLPQRAAHRSMRARLG